MKKSLSFLVSAVLAIALAFHPGSAISRAAPNPLEPCLQYGNNQPGVSVRYEDSGLVGDWSNFLKPEGRLRTIVIPIDFSDQPAKTSIVNIERNMDQVSKELKRLSNGVAELEISVLPEWVRLPRTAAFYMATNWERKINEALTAADASVDYSKFDLVLIKVDESNLVVNVAGALPMWDQVALDGVPVIRGAFLGTDYWTTVGQSVQMTIHEIMHVFGLPDLYMRNPDGTWPVGIFDLMAAFSPSWPSRVSGWHKLKLGWIDMTSVQCHNPEDPKLLSFSMGEDPGKIQVFPISSDRVLVLERFEDPYWPRRVGVIAYTVDTKRFVWRSQGSAGEISPIQMVKPNDIAISSDWNLGYYFHESQEGETSNISIQSKLVGDSLFIQVAPRGSKPLSFPAVEKPPALAVKSQKWISGFYGTSFNLSSSQKDIVTKALSTPVAGMKVICTGIVLPDSSRKATILARKRAKAVCESVKSINPAASVWFQTKTSKFTRYAGKVLLVSKS